MQGFFGFSAKSLLFLLALCTGAQNKSIASALSIGSLASGSFGWRKN